MNATDYRYRGPIDTHFDARVIPADRIKYHCDECGAVMDAGVCSQCAHSEHREAA